MDRQDLRPNCALNGEPDITLPSNRPVFARWKMNPDNSGVDNQHYLTEPDAGTATSGGSSSAVATTTPQLLSFYPTLCLLPALLPKPHFALSLTLTLGVRQNRTRLLLHADEPPQQPRPPEPFILCFSQPWWEQQTVEGVYYRSANRKSGGGGGMMKAQAPVCHFCLII